MLLWSTLLWSTLENGFSAQFHFPRIIQLQISYFFKKEYLIGRTQLQENQKNASLFISYYHSVTGKVEFTLSLFGKNQTTEWYVE